MATKYLALLTNIGAAKLAKATALGTKVEITQMAVGDGNGVLPTPNPAQTALVHELRRAPLNMLTVDPANASQIIAEQVVPEDVGGWWIREIGLFDKDGDMVAIANCAETYKPQLQEGSGRVQVIRVILIVSSTEAVTIKIDPSVVLATRKYVDDKIIEVKAYADDLLVDHIEDENPHSQYPLIANALKEMADAGLVDKVLENLGIGEAAKLGVAKNSDMQTSPGSVELLTTVAAVMSVLPTRAMSPTDYVRIPDKPGGLVIQWGTTPIIPKASWVDVTFPIPFPSSFLSLMAIFKEANSGCIEYKPYSGASLLTGCQIGEGGAAHYSGSNRAIYIAIGQ
ncbi:phage tail protein [Citrobacter farmeri]